MALFKPRPRDPSTDIGDRESRYAKILRDLCSCSLVTAYRTDIGRSQFLAPVRMNVGSCTASGNVRPGGSGPDGTHMGLRKLKVSSYLRDRSGGLTDRKSYFRGDLSVFVSMANSIDSIRSASIPSEIFQTTVRTDSVFMTRLHPGWAWTSESLQDQTMHKPLLAARQADHVVSVGQGRAPQRTRGCHPSTSGIRPRSHASEIADVVIGVTIDRLPHFHRIGF
jgi:hypothetical protein